MLERQNTINRVNTYLPKEYFKCIVIGSTKEKSEAAAQWLSGSMTSNRGVYGCPYNKSQMIVFFRWPEIGDKQATTVAVEAMLIFAENKQELEEMKPEKEKYGQIPVCVVVSPENLSNEAKDLKAVYYPKEEDNAGLKKKLDVLDKQQLEIIRKKFLEFDADGSGFIDTHEMRQIALSIGEDPDTAEFQDSMFALDFNGDGTISFTEFVAWWKIGRQNTLTLPKIHQLNKKTKELVDENFNFDNYVKQIAEVTKVPDTRSSQRVYMKSPGMYQLKTFFECGLAVGGPMRTQMALEFFSPFTKNASVAKNNWISLLITLNEKQKNLDAASARALLEEFKDNVLKWGELNANPVLVSFVKNLMLFEFSSNDNNVILVCRLKLDIEELVKGAIHQIIYVIKNLSEKDESFWFNMKTHSNFDFYETMKNNKSSTIGDFLKTSELLFEGSSFRSRLKTLFYNLNKSEQTTFKFLKTMFLPFDVDIQFDGDFNDLIDDNSKMLMNISLDKVGFVLDFLKKNLSADLLAAANNIEIGLNVFDVFAKIKFYSKSLFSRESNIHNNI